MTGKAGKRREAGSRSRARGDTPRPAKAGQLLKEIAPSREGGGKQKTGRKRTGDKINCINRLQGAVAALMDKGVDPVVIMESLTAIRRNQDLPVPGFHRLTAVIAAASGMSPGELDQLDKWLHDRIAEEKARAAQIPPPPYRIILEKRQGPGIIYQLELRRCTYKNCRKCRQGPSHGPWWYAYGNGAGAPPRRFIGRELDPQALAATIIVTAEPPHDR